MAKRTNRGVYTIEDDNGARPGGTYASYTAADRAINKKAVPGKYQVVCRWPFVELKLDEPKLMRVNAKLAVAEPAPEST